MNVDQKWRQEKRLAENPNMEGPLTNLPDFTYMDGRPTPLGVSCTKIMFHLIGHKGILSSSSLVQEPKCCKSKYES